MWYLLHLHVSKSSSNSIGTFIILYIYVHNFLSFQRIFSIKQSQRFLYWPLVLFRTPCQKYVFPKTQVAHNVLKKLYNGSSQFTPLTALLLRENVYVYHSRRSMYFISYKRVLKNAYYRFGFGHTCLSKMQ